MTSITFSIETISSMTPSSGFQVSGLLLKTGHFAILLNYDLADDIDDQSDIMMAANTVVQRGERHAFAM